jgi:DNA polymerase-3 subunit epsilon
MREVCFDTETTGLNLKDGDRLIEIGCVEIIDRKITGRTYRQLINPERKNSIESINITRITDEMLFGQPIFKEVIDEVLDFFGDSQLIAHNSSFDIGFMNNELGLLKRKPIENKVIDSLFIAKSKFPGKKNSLDALCERYKVNTTSRNEGHGALVDAKLLAEVYLKLIQKEQEYFFSSTQNKNIIKIDALKEIIKTKKKNESRNFQLSVEEEEEHKKFIEKNIKNSIFV